MSDEAGLIAALEAADKAMARAQWGTSHPARQAIKTAREQALAESARSRLVQAPGGQAWLLLSEETLRAAGLRAGDRVEATVMGTQWIMVRKA